MILWILAIVIVLAIAISLYCTWDLSRMRREAQRRIADIQAYERETILLYEAAREVYAEANARWAYVVRLEGRIH